MRRFGGKPPLESLCKKESRTESLICWKKQQQQSYNCVNVGRTLPPISGVLGKPLQFMTAGKQYRCSTVFIVELNTHERCLKEIGNMTYSERVQENILAQEKAMDTGNMEDLRSLQGGLERLALEMAKQLDKE